MNNNAEKILVAEDRRDILESALSTALGFAAMHVYIDLREKYGGTVSYVEKFIVMFAFTALIFFLLRYLTKKYSPFRTDISEVNAKIL